MTAASSALCVACGLCCSGMLFGGIRITEDEARAVERVRLPIQRDEGGATLALPCPAHVGACTIYEQRPSTCRTYRCHLLARLEQGDIDYAGALERVARLRALAERITPHLGDEGPSFWARADELMRRPLAWQIENEALLQEVVTLREMLARFIDARSRQGASQEG